MLSYGCHLLTQSARKVLRHKNAVASLEQLKRIPTYLCLQTKYSEFTVELMQHNSGSNLKPWRSGQSGNPAGRPRGSKNLSTHIRELLEDETFEARLIDPKIGLKEYKGQAVTAIIQVAITKAVNGDLKAADWLAKYGYGNKVMLVADAEQRPEDYMTEEEINARLQTLLDELGYVKKSDV